MSHGMYALLTPTLFRRPNNPSPAAVYTRNDPANTTPLTRTEQRPLTLHLPASGIIISR
jgi:hypothetical protein